MDAESFVRCVLAHTKANDDVIVKDMSTELQDFTLAFKKEEDLPVAEFAQKVLKFLELNPGLVLKNIIENEFTVRFIASRKAAPVARTRHDPFGWMR